MTLVDKAIPVYIWFAASFGIVGMILSAVNSGALLVTLITVKGIYVPSWVIPVVAASIIVSCIVSGFFMERYDIMNRIYSHVNKNQNPQMKQISEDVAAIKKMLEEPR